MQDDLITHFDRGLRRLRQEIESYPNEEALWSKAGEINNSAGNLCFHLVGNLNHFIGAGIGKTGYMRDRPREFQITAVPREALIKYVEQTRRMIWQVLRKLNDLDHPYPDDFRVESKTVGEELFRLLAHFHYHLGQINYHRRLLATHPTN